MRRTPCGPTVHIRAVRRCVLALTQSKSRRVGSSRNDYTIPHGDSVALILNLRPFARGRRSAPTQGPFYAKIFGGLTLGQLSLASPGVA